jgi:hypothetical protein
MNMRYYQQLFLILMFGWSSSSLGNDYIEWVAANSGVNWTNGTAVAEGAGLAKPGTPPSLAKMMACRAALVDAQRNLLESLQGVRVVGVTLVNNLMLESDEIKSTVEGVLQGAIMTSRRPQPDGSCEVSISAPLAGNFARDIYQNVLVESDKMQSSSLSWPIANVLAAVDWLLQATTSVAEASTGSSVEATLMTLTRRLDRLEALISGQAKLALPDPGKPTGLVIDARGSNFIPSMSPKLRRLRAGVIYPGRADQKAYSTRGQLVSLFTRDVETAKQHPLVGERPIVLKALRTWGDTRTEIVLNNDASTQLEAMISNGFMQDAGVIIVL